MRKMIFAALVFALFAPTLALAGEWTGWITDEQCGVKGAKGDHVDCAKKCVENGSKLVFYNTGDEKLYALDNQKLAAEQLGHEVKVKGDLDGTAIKVASIEPTAAAAHHHH
jgi:hypothetical protein